MNFLEHAQSCYIKSTAGIHNETSRSNIKSQLQRTMQAGTPWLLRINPSLILLFKRLRLQAHGWRPHPIRQRLLSTPQALTAILWYTPFQRFFQVEVLHCRLLLLTEQVTALCLVLSESNTIQQRVVLISPGILIYQLSWHQYQSRTSY